MTLTIPQSRPVTVGVIAALEAAGLTVQEGSGSGLTGKYVVVYSSEPALDGPLGDRYADATHTIFTHSVGGGAEQAEWVADKVAAALLGSPITVTGRSVMNVYRESSQPLQRDEDVSSPLFYVVDEWVVATTPA